MKYFQLAFTSIVLLSLLIGCASTRPPETPAAVFEMNPETECPQDVRADNWPIRAKLMEVGEYAYLAVYLDPGYDLIREPVIQLRAGYAIYEGSRGKTYFYRLGKLPKTRQIGKIVFKGVNRIRSPGSSKMRDEYIVFKMERWNDNNCLRLIRTEWKHQWPDSYN